ncbi:MAG: DUF554 domain-containing protein [Clostridiales bacterium]|nr:DUF554 domain-containing protein [Clostridiales bacterium]MDY2836264.1 DUF554 domain-containing protein [Candidatus Aphodomonas sp.]
MVGVIINVAAVLAGGTLGLLLGGRVPQRLRETIMQGLALCILLIGAQGALETANVLAVIVCMVAGGLLGEALDIEKRLESLGALAERKFAHGGQNGRFAQGFITASLLFCVGAMAVVGSLNAGLTGDNSTLIAKAALDLVTAVFFAAALGPGVLLAAAAVLVYQGAIALMAGWLAPVLTDAIVTEMSAVGGLLIMGLSFNMLGMAKIRVGNLLPAIFLPILYFPIANWIGGLL